MSGTSYKNNEKYMLNILSPAKLNLMLRILGKRDDGYHLLQTYFQILNWGDDMSFRTIESHHKVIINGDFKGLAIEKNSIYQAAQALIPLRKKQTSIEISVVKKIPQGSGMGGGSSNAGTTLRILNKLWDCRLPQSELIKIGLKLGADVPIFVMNKSSMATGIGEQLTPLEIKRQYFVLILPNTNVNTQEIFADQNLNKNQKMLDFALIEDKNSWTNGFLPVVKHRFPEINDIYQTASKWSKVYMSGTGSTLFSCFNKQQQALDFIDKCPNSWKTILCESA